MAILLGILAVPMLCILRGFVLQQLWQWFMVPQFHVADLRVPTALGIATLISYTTLTTHEKHEQYSYAEQVGIAFLHALITLGFGWVYHLFV